MVNSFMSNENQDRLSNEEKRCLREQRNRMKVYKGYRIYKEFSQDRRARAAKKKTEILRKQQEGNTVRYRIGSVFPDRKSMNDTYNLLEKIHLNQIAK